MKRSHKDRFKVIPAVFLILIKGNKILMARRLNTGWEDGNYSLVSGHIDGDESLTWAMARESQEEADLTINPHDLKLVHVMHRNTGDIKNERVDFYFIVKKWSGVPKIMEKDRCDDLSWFPVSKLPRNTIPCVREAIKNYLKGIDYSEFGWN